jgi:hypothetical protein
LQQTLCCLKLMRGNAIMQWSRTFTLELMMSFPRLSACFPSLPPSLPGNWKIEEVPLIARSREADLSLSLSLSLSRRWRCRWREGSELRSSRCSSVL